MMKYVKFIVCPVACAVLGCSSVSTDPRPVFSEVQHQVARRSGHLIQWKTNSDEDAAVRAAVQRMLEKDLTADQTVQIALLNNPRIQGFYEELGIAQAQLVQAGLLKNPVFDLSLRFVENTSRDYILEMGAAQDFLDVLLVGLRKEMARAELEVTQSEVTSRVMNLAAQAQIAFYAYQGAVQTYESNQTIMQAVEAAYDAAKRLHEAGNITDLALATQRSLYEQTKLELAASETMMLQRRERLNALMGLWGENTTWQAIAMPAERPSEMMDLSDLEGRAVGSSLDLLVLRQRMKAVAARMGIDTAELVFPEMGLGGEAEREPDGTWSVGPTAAIGVPIFDMGHARTAAGQARLRRLWHEYTALAIDIRAAARRARYRLVNARAQADYYQQVMVPLSEEITLETQLQYNAMQIGVFQLLSAKQMEISFRRNYIDALTNYWIARTEMQLLLSGHLVTESAVRLSAGGAEMMPMGGH